MIRYNISDGKVIHTQLNNKLNPGGSCGPTAGANAILSAEIPFKYPGYDQMEDYITAKLMSKEAKAYLKKIDPKAKYNPWNSIECRTWAINELAGKEIVEIQELTIEQIVFNLIKRNPIVLGGAFTKSRHIVCTVGFESTQDNILEITSPNKVDTQLLKSMIIDDSWGNYMTGYKSKDGNNNVVPLSIYKAIAMDGQKVKRCQVFFYKGIKS